MRTLAFALAAAFIALAASCTHARACEPHQMPCFPGAETVHARGESAGAFGWGGGSSRAVAIAARYLGGNPTGHGRLWCAHFMNLVERKAGRAGTGSGLAKSYLTYGRAVAYPQRGDIAVYGRRGGGHVGYVDKVERGRVLLLSGNSGCNGRRGIVCHNWRPIGSALAYRRP